MIKIKFLTITIVLFLVAACDNHDSSNGGSSAGDFNGPSAEVDTKNIESNNVPAQAVTVIDSNGSTVRLEQAAKRIIALAPHAVENVFSAGAGDRLVGVVDFSDYPEQAKSIPIVGGYQKLNIEKVIELKPDLIITWESGSSHTNNARLKEFGFTVYENNPIELEDVAKTIKDIGILAGTSDTANAVADHYLEELKRYKQHNKDKEPVGLFYQVWNSPLRTISGQHIISDAMRVCGGVNIYHDEIAVAPVINIESIIERDPEVIIASGMSSARPEWLDDWKKWQVLQAVKKDNLFFVHPDHIQRHTVRLLFGIKSICEQLDIARNR